MMCNIKVTRSSRDSTDTGLEITGLWYHSSGGGFQNVSLVAMNVGEALPAYVSWWPRGHQDLIINVQGFSVCHCGKMKVQLWLYPSMEGFPTGAGLGLSFPNCMLYGALACPHLCLPMCGPSAARFAGKAKALSKDPSFQKHFSSETVLLKFRALNVL